MGYLYIGQRGDEKNLGLVPEKLQVAAEKVFSRIEQNAPADLNRIRVRLHRVTAEASIWPAWVEWGPMGYILNIHRPFVEQLTETQLMGVIAHELGHVFADHSEVKLSEDPAEAARQRAPLEREADEQVTRWGLKFERLTVPRFGPARIIIK